MQPQSQVVVAGSNLTVSVTVTGVPSPDLQWRFNGTNLDGENLSTLTLNNMTVAQSGNYDVVVTNISGSVTSSVARLTAVNVNKTWTGGGDGVSWSDANNWSGGILPNSADSIFIGSGGTTITNVPSLTLKNLICQRALALNNSLTVTGAVQIAGGFYASGISITASGTNASFVDSGTTNLSVVNLYAQQGALVSFLSVTNYGSSGYANFNGTLQATCTGSILDLPACLNLTGPNSNGRYLTIQASSGGLVNLKNATTITGSSSGGTAYGRGTHIYADGTNSVVDLTGLEQFLGDGYSSDSVMGPSNGGQILVPNLRNVVALSLSITNGATFCLPALTNYSVGGNAGVSSAPTLQATGAGSVLNLTNLATISGPNSGAYYMTIQALAGGLVNLKNTTSITGSFGTSGSYGRGINFYADGTNSVIDMTGLQQFLGDGIYADSSLQPTSGGQILVTSLRVATGLSLYVTDGQLFSLPALTNFNCGYSSAAIVQASGVGSELCLTNLATICGPSSGSYYMTIESLAGGLVNLKNATTITGSSTGGTGFGRGINICADGTNSVIDLTGLQQFLSDGINSYSSMQPTNGGQIFAPNLRNVTSLSLYVTGGQTFSLPALTNYNCGNVSSCTVQASGVGSVLDLPMLRNIFGPKNSGYFFSIKALQGAVLNLKAVTNINGSISGGSGAGTQVTADGTGSIITLTNLASFTDQGSSGTSYLKQQNGGLILLKSNGVYSVSLQLAPTITSQPQSLNVGKGATVNFSVGASGNSLAYQWQSNGVPIPGATNSLLTLANVQSNWSGSGYSVVITNVTGAATSSVATLTIFGTAITAANLNDVWYATNSPYVVTTNLVVTNLVIQAGTTVLFSNAAELRITGLLTAAGTSNNFITFKRADAAVPWTGILFTNASTNCQFDFCWVEGATNSGVRILNTPLTFRSCVFTNNMAVYGGGIYTDSSVSLTNCTLVSNQANSQGGGIHATGAVCNVMLAGCTIASNNAYGKYAQGGGLSFYGNDLYLLKCNVTNNLASYPPTGSDSRIIKGGGLFLATGTSAEVVACEISGNTATSSGYGGTSMQGGGIYAGGDLVCSGGTRILNNQANAGGNSWGNGGGIYLTGTSALANCMIQGNSASGGNGGGRGGGIYAAGPLTVTASDVSSNSASSIINGGYGYGGGIWGDGIHPLTMANCTIVTNKCRNNGSVSTNGAGIYGALVALTNCTIAYNSASSLCSVSGQIRNSIIFFNETNQMVSCTNLTVVFSDVQGGWTNAGSTNILDTNPLFANTTNYFLAANSPCIDAGDPNPAYNDSCFPPALGTDRNDLGAYGGPFNALWTSLTPNVPTVLVNGQPASPLQVFTFTNIAPPVITFTNGFPGGTIQYTLDGSNPLANPVFSTSPLVLTQPAIIRAISFSPGYSSNAIAAPVTVNVLPLYNLSVTTPGGGSVSSGGIVLSNTVVTITATNAPGWTFLNWAGDVSSTDNPLTLAVNSNMLVRAVFGTPLNTTVSGNGTIQTNPVLALYPYGSTLQLSAVPANNNTYFLQWGGAAFGYAGSTINFTVANANPTISAAFTGLSAGNQSLTLLVNGPGTVTPSPSAAYYATGANVTLTATPSPGYSFNSWSGDATGTNNPLVVAMNTNKNITANFTGLAPVITANPLSGGVIIGQSALLNVTAVGGAPLAYQWRFNGVNISGANSATLTFVGSSAAQNGSYDVVVSNALGTATSSVARLGVFSVTKTWTGGGDDKSWNNVTNWSGGTLPNSADSIFIGSGSGTIINAGGMTLNNLICQRDLVINGSLTVTGAVDVTSSLYLASGISLTVSGTNSSFIGAGSTTADSVSMTVQQGGIISLIGLTNYNNGSATQNLIASGAGSLLDLSALQTIVGPYGSYAGGNLTVQSLQGAKVNLKNVKQIVHYKFDGNQSPRGIHIYADGTNSVVDLSAMTYFGGDGWCSSSEMQISNGGQILASNLLEAVAVSLHVSGGFIFQLPMLTNYSTWASSPSLTASGTNSVLDLPFLQLITGPYGINGGGNLTIQASQGAKVKLKGLRNIVQYQFDGNQNPRGTHIFSDGLNSVVDISALTYFGGDGWHSSCEMQMSNGGQIVATNIQTMVAVSVSVSGGQTFGMLALTNYMSGSFPAPILQANGTGSVLVLTNLQAVTGPATLAQNNGGLILLNSNTVYQNISQQLAPTILSPLQNAFTVGSGLTVAYSIAVSATTPTYRWLSNSVPVATGAASTYVLTNVQPSWSGSSYSVVISNAYGSATSSVVTLTVPTELLSTAVNGSGQIQISPAATNYYLGQAFTLTATPSRYYTFTGWSDSVTNNPRTIVINSNNVYTANFTNPVPLDTYTNNGLVFQVPVGAPVVLVNDQYSPSNSFAIPETNTITVTLQTSYPGGYLFYTLDGTFPVAYDNAITYADDTTAPTPFTVSNSCVVTAIAYDATGNGEILGDPVVISVVPVYNLTNSTPGGGSIAMNPAGGIYLSNTVVSLTPVASNGWTFLRWEGAVTNTSVPLNLTINASQSIRAVFGTGVSNNISPAGGGTVALWPTNGLYPYGSLVRITAVPSATNRFNRWFNNISGPTNNPLNFTVLTANTNMNTFFAALGTNFTVTALLNGYGTVTRSPSQNSYASNTVVQLTAVADAGYVFVNWTGDVSGPATNVNVTLNTNKLVTAVFAAAVIPTIVSQPQSLTVNRDSNAVFTVSTTNGPPPVYQWFHNGTNIPGATGTTLSIASAQKADGGNYFVVVTNIFGSATSSVAVLTVNLPYTWITLAGLATNSGSADGIGSAARFSDPFSVAVDSAGNIYVADTYNHTIRKMTPLGIVTTLAGLAGNFGSADGTGSAARFYYPCGVAVDNSDNFYVADQHNDTIRKVTPAGVVITLAGLAGVSGTNDGTGSAARFNNLSDVAVDSAGNIYTADTSSHTIRKITSGGVVTTLAGLAGTSGSADGTWGDARFYNPMSVAVDSSNNLYVADYSNHAIRKLTPDGMVTTLAGLAGNFGSADGMGSSARFYRPAGVAVDGVGNAYVAEAYNNTIRKVTPAGLVTTLGGLAGVSGSADGMVVAARFNTPVGVVVDINGNIYVADQSNRTIRKGIPDYGQPIIYGQPQSVAVNRDSNAVLSVSATFSGTTGFQWLRNGTNIIGATSSNLVVSSAQRADGGNYQVIITNNYGSATSSVVVLTVNLPYTWITFAGLATNSGSADGIGSAARFNSPNGVAVDSSNNIYIADMLNQTIRTITPEGVVTTLAGLDGQSGTNDGVGSAARFNSPGGLAVDGSNIIYVADSKNHTIRKVTPLGVVTTLAGLAGSFGSSDGTGSGARFNSPNSLAMDSLNNWYVTDYENNTVRKVTAGGVVTTLAGQAGSSGSVDGQGSAARFHGPAFVALDGANNVYVTDRNNHVIRRITPGGVVTTFAGLASSSGNVDGLGNAARFSFPIGLTIDSGGNFYVADELSHTIRKVTSSGLVTTIGGLTGVPASVDGAGNNARFSSPQGVAVDSAGNLFIADYGNQTIRKGIPDYGQPIIYGQPQNLAVNRDSNTVFSVSATFSGATGYQWLHNGTNIIGATSSNLVLTSAQKVDGGNYSVVITNSYGSATSSVAMLTVNLPYTFITLAGSVGNSGTNDGMGTSARFNNPEGVAVDGSNNVYVADYSNDTVRKITPAQVVTTLAGLAGIAGNANGVGGVAQFNSPDGIAVDNSNNVYVADYLNHTIRKVSPAGLVATLAGLAGNSGSNNGSGSLARFNRPAGVAVDSSNNLYVADEYNHTIRKVTPVGDVTTFAGLAGYSGSVDGTGSTARFSFPLGVAVDGSNNVYVADNGNHTIRKVTPAGVVTTIAGLASINGGVDGMGSNALFCNPFAIAVDNVGSLYVADYGNHTIRKVTPAGVVTTLAGLAGSSGSNDGSGSVARFYYPAGIGVDYLGGVYVADSNHTIRKGIPDYGQPIIVTQPQSQTVSASADAALSVTVFTNANPLGYQWSFDGTNLAGATSNTLTVASFQTNNVGSYVVVITNVYGSATSSVAVLSLAGANNQPPTVAITNLVTGAIFSSPVNITLNATASDADGSVAQVAFYAGTNLLTAINNAPFNFIWTNAPVGTNLLTAVAIDNFGASATSAVVSVTVNLPAPGPAVFTLSAGAYSVQENGGSVTVTILKNFNSVASVVNYATADGSAVPYANGLGNYAPASGSLAFTNGELSKTVTIQVYPTVYYVGNRTFSFQLSASGDGSSLGSPGSATITIVDVNTPASTNSFPQSFYPGSLPARNGSLRISLTPTNAGGQWRLVRETVWRNSGDTAGNLATGNYEVEFKPAPGFVPPNITTNSIVAGALTDVTNVYAVSFDTPQFGSLTLNLTPAAAVTAGAQWRVLGDAAWRNSGFTLTNLLAGPQVIEFKSATGWITPPMQAATVSPDQNNGVTVNYPAPDATGGVAPITVPFADATQPAPLAPPYPWNGQLLSDVGYGSGFVVKQRVVLTAAHVVFNDTTLSYVTGVKWFFQRYAGQYEPPTQRPRGWYVFDSYSAARTNDNSPGVSSPTSQNLDVAALYFLEDAGRGGYGGYLVSDPAATEWLQVPGSKTLIGYPVENVNDTTRGQMYFTPALSSIHFTAVTNRVFKTADLFGYPGMSGGPLCVQYTNNAYFPAAVYLGGSGQGIVRAIDGAVADLINKADTTANTGNDFVGGGVISLSSSGGLFAAGNFQITLNPPEAVAAGAGWRVTSLTNNPGTYYSDSTATYGLPAASYTLTFHAAAGYLTPANRPLAVVANQTAALTVTYTNITPRTLPVATSNGVVQLAFSATAGQRYAIERSTNLTSWAILITNTVGTNGVLRVDDSNLTNQLQRAFYRARFVP